MARQHWSSFYRRGIVLATFALALALAAICPPGSILAAAANAWGTHDRIHSAADAVVILGGGLNTRPRAALEVYKTGAARHVLISRPAPDAAQKPGIMKLDEDIIRAWLVRPGFPTDAISVIGNDSKIHTRMHWQSTSGSPKH